MKYTKTLQKLKQILDLLQQQFLNRLLPFQCTPDQLDRSITESMTPDSLGKTYSIGQWTRTQSAIDADNELSRIEGDSLNKISDRFQLRNPAKNLNCNQQISDDDETEHGSSFQSRRVRSTES